jgi:hypothetical protein
VFATPFRLARYVSTGAVGLVNGKAPEVESSCNAPLMREVGVAGAPGIPGMWNSAMMAPAAGVKVLMMA